MTKIKILDCTLRDGGHLNKWDFQRGFATDVYDAVKDTGIDFFELGYRSTPDAVPSAGEFRYTSDELIRTITKEQNPTKIAIMVDAGKIAADDFADRKYSPIDLVRIAFYKDRFGEALQLTGQLTAKGYDVALNLMGIVDYTDSQSKIAINGVKNSPAKIIYISDSYGSMHPEEVTRFVELFKQTGKPIGLHPHNNLQLAFVNSLAAIKAGAEYIDATVNGLGRGAGNLPLENILAHLNEHEKAAYNVKPVLECIEYTIPELKEIGLRWGPNPVHAMTGTLGLHPNYGSRLKEKGMSLANIYTALQKIQTNGDSGFNQRHLDKALKKS